MKKFVLIAVLVTALGAVAQTPAAPPPMAKPGLTLTTPAFDDGGIIPNKYTQSAENGAPVSPKLTWTNVPDGVVSFALILHDPDTSLNKTTNEVLHWMIFNIPGTTRELPEGVPAQAQLPDGSIQALNRGQKVGYMGMGARATWTLSSLHLRVVCAGYQAEPGPGRHPSGCVESDGWAHRGEGRFSGTFSSSMIC